MTPEQRWEWVGRRKRKYCRAKQDYLNTIRAANPCVVCGEADTTRLHFHHNDKASKSFALAEACNHSYVAIDAEIAKCSILCRTHHSRHHHRGLTFTPKPIVIPPEAKARVQARLALSGLGTNSTVASRN